TAKYWQTRATTDSDDQEETQTTMPFIVVDELQLNSVKADYQSIPDGLKAMADIKTFLLELPKADLANQEIEVNTIALQNSDFHIITYTIEPLKNSDQEVEIEVKRIVATQF